MSSKNDGNAATAESNWNGLPVVTDEGAPEDYQDPVYDYGDVADDGLDKAGDAAATPAPAAASQQSSDEQGTPAPQPQAKGAEKIVDFDDALLAEAAAYNFDPAQFSDEKSLRAAVTAFDKQVAEWGKAAIAAEGQPAGGAAQPGTAPAAPAPQAKVTEVIPPSGQKPSRFDFSKMTGDQFDPDLISALKQVDDFHAQRYEALEQQLQSIQDIHRQAAEAETEQQLDAFFGGLGEEFATLFGAGPGRELKSESNELKERVKVLEAADVLAAGYASRGQKPPADAVLLKKALQLVHSDKLEQLATSRITAKVRNRQGQFAPRPTQRQGAPASREQRAIANIGARLQKLGVNPSGGDDDSDDSGDGIY